MKITFSSAGWDFAVPVWEICDGMNYPKLAWQVALLGDFVCPDGVEMNDVLIFSEQWLLEELASDIYPFDGNGIVDFGDWAMLAGAWLSQSGDANWDRRCDIAPVGGDGVVDMDDLLVFVSQWQEYSAYCGDIAPEPDGDGVVNLIDFAKFAEQWLEGVE